MSTPPNTISGLVSVIIPVHNRLEYLPQAIESALGQSYPQVEVIVVDDGSPKDPAPVVARFDSRVRLVRKTNGGLASARNFGIAHALGEYLNFLDDDDFLEPTALEDLRDAMRAYPSATWAAGRYDYVDPSGVPLRRPPRAAYQSGNVYQPMIHHNLMGAPSVVLALSEVVRQLSAFDESPQFHMAEDYDLWLRLARVSPLAVTQQKVSNYRVHGQQFTQSQREKFIGAVLAVLQKQRAIAPPGHDEDFCRAIAQVHLSFGDFLYLGGDAMRARAQWQLAAAGGVLSARGLRWRRGKSRLPSPVLRVLRTTRKCLRI